MNARTDSMSTMVTAMIGLVTFLLAASVPVDSLSDERIDEFSEMELGRVAEMYHYRERNRPTREAADSEEEHHHHHPHHRGHMFPDYKHCCGGRKSKNHTANEEKWKTVRACAEKVKAQSKERLEDVDPNNDPFSCERMKEMKNHHYCIADCVMKGFGALTNDGTVDNEKAKEFVTKEITADWLKEIVDKAVDQCSGKIEDQRLKDEKLKCNPRAVNFEHCVWKEVMLKCPEQHLEKSEYCSRVKKAFKQTEAE